MKSTIAYTTAFLLLISSMSFAYTRHELTQLSKDTLIQIILDLQDQNGPSAPSTQCHTYKPKKGETGSLLTRLNHANYGDDGTLKYPNGEVFMLRHANYGDDYTLKYPNGATLQLAHTNYSDDQTVYWPNKNILKLNHANYSDDGTISRANGSKWLIRHANYSDDRQRVGLPVDNYSEGNFNVVARLTQNDSVTAVTTVSEAGWTIKINVNADNNEVTVEECF